MRYFFSKGVQIFTIFSNTPLIGMDNTKTDREKKKGLLVTKTDSWEERVVSNTQFTIAILMRKIYKRRDKDMHIFKSSPTTTLDDVHVGGDWWPRQRWWVGEDESRFVSMAFWRKIED